MRLDEDALRRLSRARDLLAASASPSMAAIARLSGVSRFHFIRLFEAAFGMTPQKHRTVARVDRARRLLAAGESVTSVCFEVGFSSVGSFSSLFAREVGEAPSRYQRRVRALVQVPADLERLLAPGCFNLLAALPRDAFRKFREA
jgi:AraC-like DNA-binding protein